MTVRALATLQFLLLLCSLLALTGACHHPGRRASESTESAGKVVYTKTGMRAAADRKGAWVVNSANHISAAKHIAAGAALTIKSASSESMTVTEADGTPLQIRFEAKSSMMSFDEWRARQFSDTAVELPSDLTDQERKCIRDGAAEIGISRQALFIAIGYPPARRAPDLKASSLVYATGTWGTRRFVFDDSDHLIRVED